MPVPPGCADMIRGRFIWWLEVTQESRGLGLWWRRGGIREGWGLGWGSGAEAASWRGGASKAPNQKDTWKLTDPTDTEGGLHRGHTFTSGLVKGQILGVAFAQLNLLTSLFKRTAFLMIITEF